MGYCQIRVSSTADGSGHVGISITTGFVRLGCRIVGIGGAMKPLFTIHGGEYLVGCHIEQKFKRVNVWVPSRDTGVLS